MLKIDLYNTIWSIMDEDHNDWESKVDRITDTYGEILTDAVKNMEDKYESTTNQKK